MAHMLVNDETGEVIREATQDEINKKERLEENQEFERQQGFTNGEVKAVRFYVDGIVCRVIEGDS
jgi:hypothetical protein